MKKKKSLLQKFDGLLRKARVPKYIHHFGPKTYTTVQHCKCWLLKEKLKCSWDDLFEDHLMYYPIYDEVPDVSTLKKLMKRLPFWLKIGLVKVSAGIEEAEFGAIDATGLSRTNASQHYLKRIDRADPVKKSLKLSLYTSRNRILSFRLRSAWCGDAKDVAYLTKHSSVLAETNCMDKGYDAQQVHEHFRNQGLYSIIPARKGCKRGRYRKEMRDYFDYAQYWERNCGEWNNSSLKRVYGNHVKSWNYRTQHSEITARIILHNLKSILQKLFHLSLKEEIKCLRHFL